MLGFVLHVLKSNICATNVRSVLGVRFLVESGSVLSEPGVLSFEFWEFVDHVLRDVTHAFSFFYFFSQSLVLVSEGIWVLAELVSFEFFILEL